AHCFQGAPGADEVIAPAFFTFRHAADNHDCLPTLTIEAMSASAIALNRFGLGTRPDDPSPAEPRRWLLSQLDAYEPISAPWQPLPRTPALVETWLVQQRAVREAAEGQR